MTVAHQMGWKFTEMSHVEGGLQLLSPEWWMEPPTGVPAKPFLGCVPLCLPHTPGKEAIPVVSVKLTRERVPVHFPHTSGNYAILEKQEGEHTRSISSAVSQSILPVLFLTLYQVPKENYLQGSVPVSQTGQGKLDLKQSRCRLIAGRNEPNDV